MINMFALNFVFCMLCFFVASQLSAEENKPAPQSINFSGYAAQIAFVSNKVVIIYPNSIISYDFINGKLCNPKSSQKHILPPDIDGKCAAIAVKDNFIWLMGGEGTIDGKKFQTTKTVVSLKVNSDGIISECRRSSDLPSPTKHAVAVTTDKRIILIGGTNSQDVIYADILNDNGDLSDWKISPFKYPTNISSGGAAILGDIVYANGNSTWRQGGTKMYMSKLADDGLPQKWMRVLSPVEGQFVGPILSKGSELYLFDTISGKVFCATPGIKDGHITTWSQYTTLPSHPAYMIAVCHVPGGFFSAGGLNPEWKKGGSISDLFRQGYFIPYQLP